MNPSESKPLHPEQVAKPETSLLRAPIWITVIATVILGFFGLAIAAKVFAGLASYKEEPPREEPVQQVLRVEVFEVEATDLRRFVWGFGTAQADREVITSVEVAGRITEAVDLKVGNRINARSITTTPDGASQRLPGDVLVRIDPQTYSEKVSQAESMIEQDAISLERLDTEHATNQKLVENQKRRLKIVEAEFSRLDNLLKQGAGRSTDVDRNRLELEQYQEALTKLEQSLELYPIQRKQLQSQQSSHQNALRLAQLDLEKAIVYPPFSGILSAVYVEEGQYVRPGDRLVQITDVDKVEVAVPLTLSDAAELEKLIEQGKSPIAELAQHEDHFTADDASLSWQGVVKRINPIADESTRTIQAFVEVDNTQQTAPLRPGTFVYARIEANLIPATNGVLIPRDALVDGNLFLARQVENSSSETKISHAERQPVTVLETFQTFALIKENLPKGTQVVMTNLDIINAESVLEVREVHTLEQEFHRLRVPYLEKVTP